MRAARLHAVYSGEPVMHSIVSYTYDYSGLYFVAATAKDRNGNGVIEWTLANDTNKDRMPSDNEGELLQVIDALSLSALQTYGNYRIWGLPYAGYDSGCFVIATNAACNSIANIATRTQAVFLPNGRQYSMASLLPSPNTMDIPVRTGYMVYDSGQPLKVGDTLAYVQVSETGAIVEF